MLMGKCHLTMPRSPPPRSTLRREAQRISEVGSVQQPQRGPALANEQGSCDVLPRYRLLGDRRTEFAAIGM